MSVGKVLIISSVYIPEPIVSAKLSFNIAEKLLNDGYEVKVIHPRPSRPMGFDFSSGYIVKSYEVLSDSYICPDSSLKGRIRESYSFGKFCSQYIKNNNANIDCIYLNVWPFFSQYMIVECARRLAIPTILHIQDIYPESLTNKLPKIYSGILYEILLPIDRLILSKASQLLVISENMMNSLVETRNIDANKVLIVENWQDENEFRQYNKKDVGFPKLLTFMYLGNNGPVAGVEFLIECFAKAKLEKSRLIIAGSGSKKQDCIRLAENYVGCQIEFWDVPDGKVSEIQEEADFLVLPVKKGAALSSIPSKLPAYMFSGKPIIGSLDLHSDTARAIKDADCGVVVEPENVQALVLAMTTMSRLDIDEANRMGNNGYNYALRRFSKRTNLMKVVDIIKNNIK